MLGEFFAVYFICTDNTPKVSMDCIQSIYIFLFILFS